MKTLKALAALCVLALFASLPALADGPVEFRFSAYYPESYPVFKEGFKRWEELVEKESNGKIVFKNYLNGVLHTAKHGFRAAMTDICDLTHAYPGYQPASFSLSHINDLPYALSSQHGGVLAMETLYPKYFKQEYEKMGVLLGCWVTTSEYNLITKKPVHKLEDLKGMKIRSFGGLCSTTLELLGAVPVMVQSSESYTAFQNGVVDAVLYPDSSMVSYRLYEVGKYHTRIALTRMGVPYAMSPQFFKKLSPEMKKFMYAKLRQASQMAAVAYDLDDIAARKTLKENGVEMIELAPEEMARFKKAVEPMWENFVKENEAKGLPARQLVTELRELDAKYSAMTPEQVFDLVTKNPLPGIVDF
ncbi:TRAP transporter substrate-binding protein DctP [Desulfovibrio aminophilus]|uniref:TRAP transporter substrate-binding protein n=1 Tax=Desulfovibrio aminophilus TaxID=81425 RepID=UPI0003FDC5D7|nr:TRAP transporter substrate-binding protein DctP [Desulfovibrio aminophilus]